MRPATAPRQPAGARVALVCGGSWTIILLSTETRRSRLSGRRGERARGRGETRRAFSGGGTCILLYTGVKMLTVITFEEHSGCDAGDAGVVGRGRLSLANFKGPQFIINQAFHTLHKGVAVPAAGGTSVVTGSLQFAMNQRTAGHRRSKGK